MSASLVGSEMCIRDRPTLARASARASVGDRVGGAERGDSKRAPARGVAPVSYTHLTLPTICSV
eukprot:694484-Alexandrium_andersonii.AAC.1